MLAAPAPPLHAELHPDLTRSAVGVCGRDGACNVAVQKAIHVGQIFYTRQRRVAQRRKGMSIGINKERKRRRGLVGAQLPTPLPGESAWSPRWGARPRLNGRS